MITSTSYKIKLGPEPRRMCLHIDSHAGTFTSQKGRFSNLHTWARGLETGLYSGTRRRHVVGAVLTKAGPGSIAGPADQERPKGSPLNSSWQNPSFFAVLRQWVTSLGPGISGSSRWGGDITQQGNSASACQKLPVARTFLLRDSITSPAKRGSASMSLWVLSALLLHEISSCANKSC